MRIERPAIVTGAAAGIAVALPAALVGYALDTGDDANGTVLAVLVLIVLAAFFIAGLVGGARAPDAPLTHGAIAAFLAFALIQGVGSARRAIAGDDVNVLAIAFNGLIAPSIGVFGAYFATWRAARSL